MATYSLAITGVSADTRYLIENITLPDDGARDGNMQAAMQNGTELFCKGPDGGFGWYKLDAERSTPTVPVLVRVR